MWIEKETSIAEIKTLLDNGYEVEVDSPDGYVPVNFFINKGMYEEYKLYLLDNTKVKCNESHLFETTDGWISAKEIEQSNSYYEFITSDGIRIGKIIKTNNQIPIVDINVNHPNHRYYTNGVSSHNTGVGKSLFMCHVASSVLLQGRNVLYITLEMAEERIAERIDANLLNVPIQQLTELPRQMFENKVTNLAKKTQGTLIIKEYPTASAHSGHFKALLNELSLKKSFNPDIIFIDYLNICASSRFRGGSNVNSYTLVKSIAEELRGLAVEFNVPIVSATQTTRSGYCLDLKTQVQTQQGLKDISNIQVGDLVLSNNGYNKVLNVFPKTKKKSYRITLEDGKEIICSEEHLFPTENGELNIKEGLKEGMCLYVKE
jgi:sRNA-binding protein